MLQRMDSRRNVFLWVLYDFANSVVSIVFFLYFAQWIVVDQGVSDFRFNLTFSISALLLLCTVPTTGVLLDRSLRRITGLRFTTGFTALFYILCAACALTERSAPALVFYTLGLFMYLLSFTFYTPLLNDISRLSNRGRVSGLGIMANYIGQFVGLLIALPFSNGSMQLFGSSPRAETLLPATVVFFLCSLPMLLLFTEPRRSSAAHASAWQARHVWSETKRLFGYSGVGAFLLSYFLFNDALLTASNNFPIFMEQVWHVSDTVKTYILLGILVTCGIGGLASGTLADRFGHRRMLLWILAGWVIILPLIGLLTNFLLFVIATTLMGTWFGASWTVSRSVMSSIAPAGKHNLAFAYFGLAERASSFVGPMVWGSIVSGMTSLGSDRYRVSVVAMAVFVVFGFLALRRVPDDRSELEIEN